MLVKNTKAQYGLVTVYLHWLMAVLIIGMLGLGLYMSDLPTSLEKLKLYGWHKEFGVLVLLLALFRLVWRLSNITPRLNIIWYEKFLARLMQWAFYAFMIAMPISGWLMSSATGFPPSFFGLFTLPSLMAPNPALMKLFQEIHKYIAYAFVASIVLHILGYLKHHFFDKSYHENIA